MRKAGIQVHGRTAGTLIELDNGAGFEVIYDEKYEGPPISLTMPVSGRRYFFERFPPYFEGVLPEGVQLEGLLKRHKVNSDDLYSQLMVVGGDLVGAVTVNPIIELEVINDENGNIKEVKVTSDGGALHTDI